MYESMSEQNDRQHIENPPPVEDLTLSDYVERAAVADTVQESDGSTVVYLHLRQLERYSTLPRPRWRGWISRVVGGRSASSSDALGRAANVRRVPRRFQ